MGPRAFGWEMPYDPEEAVMEGWTIELDKKRNEHYFWHEETETSSWTHPVTGKFPDGSEPGQPEDTDDAESSTEEVVMSSDDTEGAVLP
eukprot:COSAG02_NODE_3396_length_6813_cov_7.067024_2_plen_89_part_00